MLRAALVALAALSLTAVAAAQSTQAVRPTARPTYPGNFPSNHHTGNYQPVIVINPSDYLSPAAKPHKRKPNQSHADQYPGQETFSSRSTDGH